MNRRSFFQAAAASTAAVLASGASADSHIMNAPGQAESSPAVQNPLEVNIADPGAPRCWRDRATDVFVQLEELHPGDPGQLSGTVLRIMEAGRYASLQAEIGDVQQPYGGRATHCLGYLGAGELAQLADDAESGEALFTRPLRELYPCVLPNALSGARLIFVGGDRPEMQLCFGAHCLGVVRGQLLKTFLRCARMRSTEAARA
ncbi:MAG: hypothetical protein LAQ30_18920 [Acidobacteriia bacterium]|nr:hypothetical protein [Terriglobia bacterium]